MLSALMLPRLLEKITDRSLMVVAAFLLAALTIGHALYMQFDGLADWSAFLFAWAASGIFYSAILTPSGRLLRNSAHSEDRPAVFAAQFALSHACWLLTYPAAGWVGDVFGLSVAMGLLGALALAGAGIALYVWPFNDAEALEHDHADLPMDHPHLREFQTVGNRHRHVIVIDDEHRSWPTRG